MPIAYTCPHCGKQYSVAEQYAGQTGPCAACGQQITVPLAMPGAYVPAPRSSGSGGVIAIIVVLAVVLLAVPCVLVAVLLPAVGSAREQARQSQSMNNMKQLGLAIHNYHDVYKAFPPSVVKDASGQPLYSGRVLLLPFLEQQALFTAWKPDEPWDGPTNLPLSRTTMKVFQDPSNASPAPGETNYFFITGTGAMFEDTGRPITFAHVSDGTSNTIMMIEVKSQGTSWAEPREIDISAAVPLPAGSRPGGNLALFGDGSVRMIPNNLPPQTIQAALTRNGGEPISLP